MPVVLYFHCCTRTHGVGQRNREMLAGIFLSDEENDSLALQS